MGVALINDCEVTCPALQVACGDHHSAALSADGRLFTWGRGKYGQLGHGHYNNLSKPKLVTALRGLHIVQVACGGDHTLVITREGVLYSWGRGTWVQTGLGYTGTAKRTHFCPRCAAGARTVLEAVILDYLFSRICQLSVELMV